MTSTLSARDAELHEAVQRGNEAMALAALDGGANIESVNEVRGRRTRHTCCARFTLVLGLRRPRFAFVLFV